MRTNSITLASALVSAILLAGATSVSAAPAAKPKKCPAGKIAVVTGKKRTCMTRGQLSRGVPSGASFGEAIASLTFTKGLWRGSGRKAVADPLGKAGASFRGFDLALVGASQHTGKPLLPDSPSPTAKATGGGEETLGLDVSKTPYGWSTDKAEQARKWVEEANGVQTQKRETEGSMYETLKNEQKYSFNLEETFQGDPCPKPGKKKGEGSVDGTLRLVATREVSGFLSNSIENVATVILDFHGYVGKDGKLKNYEVAARVQAADGSWRGTAFATGLKPRAGPTAPSPIPNVQIGTVSRKIDTQTVTKIVYLAIDRGRTDVEKWLTASEGIWFTKAECNNVTPDKGGKIKPGQQKTIKIKVGSIRGPTTASTVTLKGLNGLEVVGAKEVTTAKDGTVEVTVRAAAGKRSLAALGATPVYELGIEGVSELGRGVGTVSFQSLPTRIEGSFSGTATGLGGTIVNEWRFAGTVAFVLVEQSTGPAGEFARYEVERIAYTSTYTYLDTFYSCSGTSITESASLGRGDRGLYSDSSLSLAYEPTPGKGHAYQIDVVAAPPAESFVIITCADSTLDMDLGWQVAAEIKTEQEAYYTDGTTFRGTYAGPTWSGGGRCTCTWDLTASDEAKGKS